MNGPPGPPPPAGAAAPQPVTFFLPGEADLAALARLDPEGDWREFVRGERAWILQTYLRLVRAGYPAALAGTLPESGLVVFHAKHKRRLLACGRRLARVTLVGVRADHREPAVADFEVLQNGRFADGRRRFHLPHWPQAGLVPRDPARRTRVARVAYKGFLGNLHPGFRQSAWRRFLDGLGIDWATDAVEFSGRATDPGALSWNDYSGVDLVLAVRPPSRRLHTAKPATKLFNAWHAGTPALLGPEWAYREVRRSPLDYLEVASPDEARLAVTRLAESPDLYRRMVEHGRRRAQEVSFEAVTRRWAELLYETLPPLAALPAVERLRRLPPRLKIGVKSCRRLLALQPRR